jgi:hypothetical protein
MKRTVVSISDESLDVFDASPMVWLVELIHALAPCDWRQDRPPASPARYRRLVERQSAANWLTPLLSAI